MKFNLNSCLMGIAMAAILFIGTSYVNKTEEAKQYAQITALESHIKGGMGRSRLVITYSDGRKEESALKNYQSMTGINFSNVTGNEKAIVEAMNKLSSQGYDFKWLESGVSEGIYITKYVYEKKQ